MSQKSQHELCIDCSTVFVFLFNFFAVFALFHSVFLFLCNVHRKRRISLLTERKQHMSNCLCLGCFYFDTRTKFRKRTNKQKKKEGRKSNSSNKINENTQEWWFFFWINFTSFHLYHSIAIYPKYRIFYIVFFILFFICFIHICICFFVDVVFSNTNSRILFGACQPMKLNSLEWKLRRGNILIHYLKKKYDWEELKEKQRGKVIDQS